MSVRHIEGADGVPLAVHEAGKQGAPGILFLHGFSLGAHVFESQLNSSLADDFHLAAFDLRGHGDSGKPWHRDAYSDEQWTEDIQRVITAIDIDRPIIVGWSFGAGLAISYYRRFGVQGTSGLVLVGSLAGLSPLRFSKESLRNFEEMTDRAISSKPGHNVLAAKAFVKTLTRSPHPDCWDDQAHCLALMMPPYVRRIFAEQNSFLDSPKDNSDLIDGLDIPMLLAAGTHDIFAPENTVRNLAKRLPCASSVIFDDAGHAPFIEATSTFNETLKTFAAGLTPHSHHAAVSTL